MILLQPTRTVLCNKEIAAEPACRFSLKQHSNGSLSCEKYHNTHFKESYHLVKAAGRKVQFFI